MLRHSFPFFFEYIFRKKNIELLTCVENPIQTVKEGQMTLYFNHEAIMWLSAEQVAQRYGIPTSTLAKMRHKGTGIPFVRYGRVRGIRYKISDVEDWLASKRELGFPGKGVQS